MKSYLSPRCKCSKKGTAPLQTFSVVVSRGPVDTAYTSVWSSANKTGETNRSGVRTSILIQVITEFFANPTISRKVTIQRQTNFDHGELFWCRSSPHAICRSPSQVPPATNHTYMRTLLRLRTLPSAEMSEC